MTRHELNDVFLRTSFLQGANATYLAELYARYEEDPNSLDPEWRAFFASLDDNRADVIAGARGPSWAPSNGTALAPAAPRGSLSEREALAAAQDTLGARMLIRAYRTRGHLGGCLRQLVARGGGAQVPRALRSLSASARWNAPLRRPLSHRFVDRSGRHGGRVRSP